MYNTHITLLCIYYLQCVDFGRGNWSTQFKEQPSNHSRDQYMETPLSHSVTQVTPFTPNTTLDLG